MTPLATEEARKGESESASLAVPSPHGWRERVERLLGNEQWVGWLLFATAFGVLLATEATAGFTRDESVYFAAAEAHARWFQLLFRDPSAAFADGAIVGAFDFNHEHPALMKNLFGLSYLLFHEGLGWLRPAAAFRLPAFAIAALIPLLLYRLGCVTYGRRAALFAALSFFLVPRQFFNAQLSCFDMPVAAMWLLTVYTFWKAQRDRRYVLACGLAFGLSLATKHNALFLPFVLGPFALYRAFQATRANAPARATVLQLGAAFVATAVLYGLLSVALGPTAFVDKFQLLSPHLALFVGLTGVSVWLLRKLEAENLEAYLALAPIAAMAVLGPVIFYLHWPYLWHHPVDRTAWYLAFHATHNHYTWFYLGKLLREPPFPLSYVLVKTALTVPTSLGVPMVTGFVALSARLVLGAIPRTRRWFRRPDFTEMLIGVNAVAAIAIISHPDVPHFGGVKHWLPSMPFLALLSGDAVDRACRTATGVLRGVARSWSNSAVTATLFALLLLPAAVDTWRNHPYGTSFYSELAGGLPGAASLGMQRQFWSANVTGVLPYLNEHAPPGARVYLHEVNGLSFRDYQRNGMLRKDLVPAGGPADSQFAAYQYHQEFRENEFNLWEAYGTQKPVFGLYLDETPQVLVFQRR